MIKNLVPLSVLFLLGVLGIGMTLEHFFAKEPDPDRGLEGTVTRRVCVDGDTDRAAYLDGMEFVGPVLGAANFGLTGAITAAELAETGDIADSRNRYFFDETVGSGNIRLSVSLAGASDLGGLDADQVYPVRVRATVDNDVQGTKNRRRKETRQLDIGVWLDTATISSSGDGSCP